MPTPTDDPNTPPGRTFLCVVDKSEEFGKALRFACRRAVSVGGRVALLYVLEPAEFQHWAAVGNLMREERRQEAEEMLQVVSTLVQKRTGQMPALYIREGDITEEILKLIDEEKHISLLVLGAATGPEGPGPITISLVEKQAGRLHVPVTIVPGNMPDEHIDAIT